MLFPYSPDLVIPPRLPFPQSDSLHPAKPRSTLKATAPVFPGLRAVSSLSHPLWHNTVPRKVLFQECLVVIKHQFCAKCLI